MNNKFIGKTCIVRANGAGVFIGEIIEQDNDTVLIKNSRRLWRWDGANSLSDLAMNGVANPNQCKFPVVVNEALIFKVLEIIPATDKAIKSIEEVKTWTMFQ